MTCGDEIWIGKAFVTAGQAILSYAGMYYAGGFVPGETVTLVANFQNIGHYMATNAIATIECENEYVTILNETVEVGTIDPNGVAACVFEIAIDEDCPENEQIVVNFGMTADGGLTAEGSATLKNSCNVIFDLEDQYGDGWNGAKITVLFDDGTPSQDLTCNGAASSYTIEMNNGVHVTLNWTSGSWDSECSFTVSYEDGTVIYESQNLHSGTIFEFDCTCGNTPIIGGYSPVDNLEYSVDYESIILTWDAPEGAIDFTIFRNGIEISTEDEPTYVDFVDYEGSYTYCVVANYFGGSSLPECLVVEAEWGIEENEAAFSIYPNPTSSTLYVNCGNAQYSYEMFNGMGQMVATGNGQGTNEISVNGLAKGVYFLRLTSGTQVRMEKVVVE